MDRRTFLKAVFAAAVAPPSVVDVLYKPRAFHSYTFSYDPAVATNDYFVAKWREAVKSTTFQPPKGIAGRIYSWDADRGLVLMENISATDMYKTNPKGDRNVHSRKVQSRV